VWKPNLESFGVAFELDALLGLVVQIVVGFIQLLLELSAFLVGAVSHSHDLFDLLGQFEGHILTFFLEFFVVD
jgi:hypothetical protein